MYYILIIMMACHQVFKKETLQIDAIKWRRERKGVGIGIQSFRKLVTSLENRFLLPENEPFWILIEDKDLLDLRDQNEWGKNRN